MSKQRNLVRVGIRLAHSVGMTVVIGPGLDRNLFELPSSEINEARVTMTIFGGRTVYE